MTGSWLKSSPAVVEPLRCSSQHRMDSTWSPTSGITQYFTSTARPVYCGGSYGQQPCGEGPQSHETTGRRMGFGIPGVSKKQTMTSRSQVPRRPRRKCSAPPWASVVAATQSRKPARCGFRSKKRSRSCSARA